jgi:hypothetical protein
MVDQKLKRPGLTEYRVWRFLKIIFIPLLLLQVHLILSLIPHPQKYLGAETRDLSSRPIYENDFKLIAS